MDETTKPAARLVDGEATLREILRELLWAVDSECPNAKAGIDVQNAWAERIKAARENADAALAAIPADPVAWISASELEKLKAGHAAFVTPGGGDGDTPLYNA